MNHEEVMISYSRKNTPVLEWLVDVLARLGVSAWFDGEILAGKWRECIARSIVACKVVLIIWTTELADSDMCEEEVIVAKETKKVIIPRSSTRRCSPTASCYHWPGCTASSSIRLPISTASGTCVAGFKGPESASTWKRTCVRFPRRPRRAATLPRRPRHLPGRGRSSHRHPHRCRRRSPASSRRTATSPCRCATRWRAMQRSPISSRCGSTANDGRSGKRICAALRGEAAGRATREPAGGGRTAPRPGGTAVGRPA